jgi:hypothetical protein
MVSVVGIIINFFLHQVPLCVSDQEDVAVNSGELDPPIPGDVDPPQEVLEEQ